MKKRINLYTVIGISYVMLWTGLAIGYIGKMPSDCNEPFTWEIVLAGSVRVVDILPDEKTNNENHPQSI